MPEPIIQVKLKATDRLAPARERIAYRMFAQGIADISPNAVIVAKDEEEESEIRMTIAALIEQRSKIPHGKAFAQDERQEPMDTEVLSLFQEMMDDPHYPRVSVEQFVAWAREKHPEVPYKFATFERSMRRLRASGKHGLETDGSSTYWMRAKKEQITA